MTSITENTFDINSYLNSLSTSDRENMLKEIGKNLDLGEVKMIKESNMEKRRKERLRKSLQKYRNSWKTLRCYEGDMDCDWVNNWWKNNRMTDRNKILKGYEDIILGSEGNSCWTAITGTDCEWFEESSSLREMINSVMYHNSSGQDNWGVGTIGGSHEHVDRIFIGSEYIKHFEGDEELFLLKNRYKNVYILDYNNPFLDL